MDLLSYCGSEMVNDQVPGGGPYPHPVSYMLGYSYFALRGLEG